jgi:hypothetical protein
MIKTKAKRKWSKGTKGARLGAFANKYKKSINCKRPKGFSQKQYCKYGRNKTRRSKGTEGARLQR